VRFRLFKYEWVTAKRALRFDKLASNSSPTYYDGKAGVFGFYMGSGRADERMGIGLFVDPSGLVTKTKFDHFGWVVSEQIIGKIKFPVEFSLQLDEGFFRASVLGSDIAIDEIYKNSKGVLHPLVGGYSGTTEGEPEAVRFEVRSWTHEVPLGQKMIN
jgi:hypothetical protein